MSRLEMVLQAIYLMKHKLSYLIRNKPPKQSVDQLM